MHSLIKVNFLCKQNFVLEMIHIISAYVGVVQDASKFLPFGTTPIFDNCQKSGIYFLFLNVLRMYITFVFTYVVTKYVVQNQNFF